MEKRSVKKNYIYNLFYEVLTILVPLITTPYVSEKLGPEGIGTYSYTYSIVTYFMLVAALGTTVYGRREIAYNQDKPKERSTIFWEVVIFRTVMTIVCLSVYIAFIMTTDYKIIGIIQSLYIISVIFDVTWFFQGIEDFKLVVIRNTFIKLVNIAFIFIFVKSSQDLNKYIFGLAVLPLLGNLITLTCLPKYIKKISLKELHPFKHFSGAISLFIPTIAAQVYLVLDKTMIGVITGTKEENGYYEQAQKIVQICWTFLTTFSAVMSPRMANIIAKKDYNSLKDYLNKSFGVVWFMATPIAFGLAAISSNLVPWFFGMEFSKVSILLLIFCWIVFPIGISSVTGNQYLVVAKKHFPYTLSIIVGAVINFTLNLFLIPRYFSIGAAIASIIAEVIIAIVQLWFMIYKYKIINVKDIFAGSWKYLISGVIMLLIVRYASVYLPESLIGTTILICAGAIIYCVSLFILRDKFFIDNVNKYFNKFKKMLVK